jgi:8-oxo-dGTP pyrophosphatase MutT (NUDIX family)
VPSLSFFDPREVPVVGVDSQLPKVNPYALKAHSLAARFERQHVWTPEIVSEPPFVDRLVVSAAVLIPLVLREQLTVLLTERATNLSSHSGQVAFPGGKSDPHDADATATALREAYEEVGLARRHVQVLGSLPLYTTGSAFIVTPVVALVQPDFELIPNPQEVADVFEVPLAFLMDPANHRHHVSQWGGVRRQWISMSYQDASAERFIWGATAAMFRNLYRFMLD